MQTVVCCACGIEFCMEYELYRQRKADHNWFYCPNGHRQHFPQKTEHEKRIEQLEGMLASEQQRRDNWRRMHSEVLDEFATCPFDNCPARTYHYANRQTLLRHLADRHGIRLIERKALMLGKSA